MLTSAKGFTLYWFAPDTATKSHCNGSCAHYWPPVKGPATAGTGVTGTLATITRSDGTVQATWNGHPLYTYISDTAPGQAKGNGLNLSGGVWHAVTISGTATPATSPPPNPAEAAADTATDRGLHTGACDGYQPGRISAMPTRAWRGNLVSLRRPAGLWGHRSRVSRRTRSWRNWFPGTPGHHRDLVPHGVPIR